MATADVLAKSAREKLAQALNALQTSADPPVELLELAEPIAQAMGILHRIERSAGNDLSGREVVSQNIRGALDKLQQMTVSHEALDAVMEQVAGCLAAVHQITRLPLPGAPPAPASAPRAAPAPVASAPASAPGSAATPASGAAPVKPTAHGVGPSVPSPITAPPAFAPAPAPTAASRLVANIPPPAGPAQPSPVAMPAQPSPVGMPAQATPVAMPAQPTPVAMPAQPTPVAPAPKPAPPNVTQHLAPAPAAVATSTPVAVASTPLAAPQAASHAGVAPGRGTVRMEAPVVPAQGFAPPPAAITPPPAPVAQAPAPARAPTPSSTGNVVVELGTHSVSNFYKGLSGNDVLEHGGIFVATYKIPKLGMQVNLRVLLPGDYEFQAIGVVQWIREASAGGDSAEPGFGAKLTQITPEGRQLVYRYARNREPMFYDDL